MAMTNETKVAGKIYCSNETGRGVFSPRKDGTYTQHIGTCDTPKFKSKKQLGAWVRRNLDPVF